MAEVRAPMYNATPTIKLPLNPITIDEIAVSTVAMTDAIMLTPHKSVMSSLLLRGDCDEDVILVIEGN